MTITMLHLLSRSTTPALPIRGPLTERFVELVSGHSASSAVCVDDDPLVGDDLHMALYLGYELAYRGLPGVDPRAEWDPALLAFRRRLEHEFEHALRTECTHARSVRDAGATVDALLEQDWGPSLSTFVSERGTRAQHCEFLIHRSAYQLKEADPHTWAIPRLPPGARKSAFIEIQFEEYGHGRAGATHAELFARALDAAGLRSDYGYYVDRLPGTTLATCNLISMFGLHRHLAAALLGHLAVFEMTSVDPMSRYSRGAARLGFGPEVREFYDVHVDADEHHGNIARQILLGGDLRADGFDPSEVVFGAEALLHVERRFAEQLLDAWNHGHTALWPAIAEPISNN